MLRSLFHSFVVALVAAVLISIWLHFNVLNSSDFVTSSLSSLMKVLTITALFKLQL